MRKLILGIVVVVLLVAGVGLVAQHDRIARKLSSFGRSIAIDRSAGEKDFPAVDTSQLSEVQKKIARLAKQEFLAQSPGTKFSEGAGEAWCADFVSWVMKEAGQPLKNPVSGSWRIPGTYTLLDYYKQQGMFREVGSGYTPKLGDVAIYRSSPIFGDHTNFVLSDDDGVITTVGGNENGRIRVYKNSDKQYDGLLGYGEL